jgi:hypothetical protein
MSAGALSSMCEFIDEKYDDHERLKAPMDAKFYMRVVGPDINYVVEITVYKVDAAEMVKFDLKRCNQESNIKCFLLVSELGIPCGLPDNKLDQNIISRREMYKNTKGDEQRRRYRKKCSTLIRDSKMVYVKEALISVHKPIYEIVCRTKIKKRDVMREIEERPLVI